MSAAPSQMLREGDKPTNIYKKLDEYSIRLVEVLAGGPLEPIQCTLYQVLLLPDEEPPYYCALSYAWGDVTDKVPITLNDQILMVTRNLHDALYQFRSDETRFLGKYLWIDALSINQDDINERSAQVKRMSAIYTRAGSVVTWLGRNHPEEDEDIRFAFEIAEAMYQWLVKTKDISQHMVEAHPALRYSGPVRRVHRTAVSLERRAWFKRMWVVQEYCFGSKNNPVYAGRHSTGLFKLTLLDHLLLIDTGNISLRASLRFTRVVNTKIWAERKLKSKQSLDPDVSEGFGALLYLLLDTTGLLATVPHDRIYSLLSLAGRWLGNELPAVLSPDYSLPYTQVYITYARHILLKARDLRLLETYRGWLADMPSWAPDLRYLLRNEKGSGFLASVSFSPDGKAITLEGTRIGTCEIFLPRIGEEVAAEVSSPTVEGELLRYMDLWKKEILDPSCAKLGLTSKTETLEYYRSGQFEVEKLAVGINKGLQMGGDDAIESLEALRSVSQFGSILMSSGRIASFVRIDADVLRGDVVCVFKGSINPSVLRLDGDEYTFVGTCRLWPTSRSDIFTPNEEYFLGREMESFTLK